VGVLDLVQLGAVDVDVDDLGVRAELGGLADGAVVEAGADADQQVGLFEHVVGVAGAVHAQHADGQRVVHGHRAEGHQGHGGRQRGLLGQGHGHRAAPEWITPPPR
jgi:hypothetical protein